MGSLEITYKAFRGYQVRKGPAYDLAVAGFERKVARQGARQSDELLMTVRKLKLVNGETGDELGSAKENFWSTTTSLKGADGADLAHLTFPFPLTSLKKRSTLHLAGHAYSGSWQGDPLLEGGSGSGNFKWVDDKGAVTLEIRKEISLTPQFTAEFAAHVPREVAVLAAVAIHRRFFASK